MMAKNRKAWEDEPQWFVALARSASDDPGSVRGPLSLAALEQWWERGRIDGATPVWRAGMSDWTPVGRVDALSHLVTPDEAIGVHAPARNDDVEVGRCLPPPLPSGALPDIASLRASANSDREPWLRELSAQRHLPTPAPAASPALVPRLSLRAWLRRHSTALAWGAVMLVAFAAGATLMSLLFLVAPRTTKSPEPLPVTTAPGPEKPPLAAPGREMQLAPVPMRIPPLELRPQESSPARAEAGETAGAAGRKENENRDEDENENENENKRKKGKSNEPSSDAEERGAADTTDEEGVAAPRKAPEPAPTERAETGSGETGSPPERASASPPAAGKRALPLHELTVEEIVAGVRANSRSLLPCLEAARHDETIRAGTLHLVLDWTIADDGSTKLAYLRQPPELVHTRFATCVQTAVSAWRFVAPGRDTAITNFPIGPITIE